MRLFNAVWVGLLLHAVNTVSIDRSIHCQPKLRYLNDTVKFNPDKVYSSNQD